MGYRYLRLVSKLSIKKYWFLKLVSFDRKLSLTKFGIETGYRKVLIPQKGIDTQHQKNLENLTWQFFKAISPQGHFCRTKIFKFGLNFRSVLFIVWSGGETHIPIHTDRKYRNIPSARPTWIWKSTPCLKNYKKIKGCASFSFEYNKYNRRIFFKLKNPERIR